MLEKEKPRPIGGPGLCVDQVHMACFCLKNRELYKTKKPETRGFGPFKGCVWWLRFDNEESKIVFTIVDSVLFLSSRTEFAVLIVKVRCRNETASRKYLFRNETNKDLLLSSEKDVQVYKSFGV